jgi:hypothetical protein
MCHRALSVGVADVHDAVLIERDHFFTRMPATTDPPGVDR